MGRGGPQCPPVDRIGEGTKKMTRKAGATALTTAIVLIILTGPAAMAGDWRVEKSDSGEKITLIFDEAALSYLTPSFADDFLSDMFVALAWDGEVKGISVGIEMDGKVVPVDELWMPPAAVMDSIRRQGEENYYLWSISPPPPRHLPATGSLQGKRIFISPGHGLTWVGSGWYTQRGEYQGIIEDDSNARMMFHFMIPMLERMGATVFNCRERGNTKDQVVVDNDPGSDGSYEETGDGWAAGSGDGYGGSYRICPAAADGGSAAHFYFTMPVSNVFPVYMRWVADSVHNPSTKVRVVRPDTEFEVTVNQVAEDRRWYYLGSWYFSADTEYEIVVANNGETGSFVVADAIRVGGGMGEIYPSGASPSGDAKWREAAKYWIQYVGAPSDVYNYWHPNEGSSDVVSRPLYADWEGGDAYFSHHSNGFDGTARGTVSFIHESSPSPGSAEWQEAIHTSLIHTIKTIYDPDWYDRGFQSEDFGELRLVDTMPAVLMETAFHDNAEDAEYLKTPIFRHDVTRAMTAGMGRYFSPGLPAPPLPPVGVRAELSGPGSVTLSWDTASDPAENVEADRFRVYTSRDGRAFDNGDRTADETSLEISGLDYPANYYFLVTAENDGGESMPSEQAGVCTSWTGNETVLLLVNGFDRLDPGVREWENTKDFVVQHAEAIASVGEGFYTFDYASNEAVDNGDIELDAYMAVIWWTGEESTEFESFSDEEMAIVGSYLASGGKMFISGSEIGWDLDEEGDETTRAWLRDVLRVGYVSDDAETYSVSAATGGIFEGMSDFDFDDGSVGTYDPDWPDVLEATGGSTVNLQYATPGGAGLEYDGGEEKIVFFGFPFEAVLGKGVRAELMERILFFLVPDVPQPPEEDEVMEEADAPEDMPEEPADDLAVDADGADIADVESDDGDPDSTDVEGGCSCRIFYEMQ